MGWVTLGQVEGCFISKNHGFVAQVAGCVPQVYHVYLYIRIYHKYILPILVRLGALSETYRGRIHQMLQEVHK